MNPLEGRSVCREPRLTDSAQRRALDHEPSTLWESPGGDGFIALLKAFRGSGGIAPSDIFAPVFAQHQFDGAPTLQAHINRAEVFGFEWRDHLWLPLFQFDAARFTFRPSVQEVRASLPAWWSGWHLAAWFARPHEHLHDRSPVDVLDQCPADVLRAAQSQRLGVGRPSAPLSQSPTV